MAGITSIENGRLGGRKKGFSAIKAEEARKIISAQLSLHLPKIIDGLINEAISGNTVAARELFDRAWGKSYQPSNFIADHNSAPLIIRIVNYSTLQQDSRTIVYQ